MGNLITRKFEGNFGSYELGSCQRINCSFDIGIETNNAKIYDMLKEIFLYIKSCVAWILSMVN